MFRTFLDSRSLSTRYVLSGFVVGDSVTLEADFFLMTLFFDWSLGFQTTPGCKLMADYREDIGLRLIVIHEERQGAEI